MRQDKIATVVRLLDLNRISPEDISPNLVNLYANRYGIELTSDEVVYISNNY